MIQLQEIYQLDDDSWSQRPRGVTVEHVITMYPDTTTKASLPSGTLAALGIDTRTEFTRIQLTLEKDIIVVGAYAEVGSRFKTDKTVLHG